MTKKLRFALRNLFVGVLVGSLVASISNLPAVSYQSSAYDRGCAEMARRDFDGAIISFGECIGLDMNNMDAYFKRGKCFYNLDNFGESIKDFSHIIDFNSKDVNAYLWRGTANSRLGSHDAAVRDYLSAIRLKPELAEQFQSAEGNTQVGESEQDIQIRGRSVAVGRAENKGAVKDYEQAMSLYLNHKDANELSRVESAEGLREERTRGGRDAVQSHGSNRDGQTLDRSDSRHRRSTANVPETDEDIAPANKQSYDKDAIRDRIAKLNNALELDDRNQQLIFRRGLLYEKLQNYDQSLADFSRAVNLAPMNANFYLARARVYHALNQPYLEQDDLDKARSVDARLPRKTRSKNPVE